MEINQVPILRREDLVAEYKNASINKILKNKPFNMMAKQKFHKFNLLLFIDDNGDVFIIKNRFGRDSKDYLENIMNLSEAAIKRYINAENFIMDVGKKWWWKFNLKKRCFKFLKQNSEEFKKATE